MFNVKEIVDQMPEGEVRFYFKFYLVINSLPPSSQIPESNSIPCIRLQKLDWST
jgi:hypothetical protein